MKRFFDILTAFALFSAAGCVDLQDLKSFFDPESARAADVEPSVAATYVGEPKIRSGLVVEITVTAAGAQAFEKKQYQVDSEGKILMPLIGAVKCDGLTLLELCAKVEGLYREYINEPQATAVFIYSAGGGMASPWGTVMVLGEVGHPGPVDMPSTQDLTVTRALQLAGNPTNLANTKNVQVSHCDKDGKITKTRVNLVEIGKEGRMDLDLHLYAGDVLWVPMSYY